MTRYNRRMPYLFNNGGPSVREIKVDDGSGNIKNIPIDSPEYRSMYNEGRIGFSRDNGDISMGALPEARVVFDRETGRNILEDYPYYNKLTEEQKKYFRNDGAIGRQIRSIARNGAGLNADGAKDFAMTFLRDLPLASVQAPQSALVEGVEYARGNDSNILDAFTPGKQRVPSEVWGFETTDDMPWYNPKVAGNFAMDVVADPVNIAGVGLFDDVLRAGAKRIPSNAITDLGVEDLAMNGIGSNILSKPLTVFTKNELTPGNHLYRKIGNESGLYDLIEKGGAQAPAPLRMRSGQTIDTPFFGHGDAPNESYRGIFAVEHSPESMSKYEWSNRVGGVSNYGVAPFDRVTGESIQKIPLDDLEVFRRKWFSNNYRKLNKENLEKELRSANLQALSENLYKWGVRGYLADQILNDGDLTGGNAATIILNKLNQ